MEPVPSDYYQLELPYKPSSTSVYWKKITIPKGLPALLETFVREAIRENPDDIYKFLANLTESLLAKRAAEEQEAESNAGFKKEKQAADEESPLLDSQIPIPTSYKIEDQKEVQSSQAQKEPVSKEEVETSVSPTSSSLAVVEQDASTLDEETAAATKIQSGFRGFKTRKELREQNKQQEAPKSQEQPGSPTTPTSPTTTDVVLPEAEHTENDNNAESETAVSPQPEEIAAATKIQSGFRGYKTRKELREQVNQNDDSKSPTIPEEVILESVTVAPVGSAPPEETVSTSPSNPPEKEVDDEEIAAEIKTPLETIREESFDLSSSAHHPIPLNPATSPDADVINENEEEKDADKGVLERVESSDIERSKPNSAASEGRAYQVET